MARPGSWPGGLGWVGVFPGQGPAYSRMGASMAQLGGPDDCPWLAGVPGRGRNSPVGAPGGWPGTPMGPVEGFLGAGTWLREYSGQPREYASHFWVTHVRIKRLTFGFGARAKCEPNPTLLHAERYRLSTTIVQKERCVKS